MFMCICLSILFSKFYDFTCSWALSRCACVVGSRPLRRSRHGDVTKWYQSCGLQQWASMGQEDAVTEEELPSVQHRSEFEMAATNFKHLPKCWAVYSVGTLSRSARRKYTRWEPWEGNSNFSSKCWNGQLVGALNGMDFRCGGRIRWKRVRQRAVKENHEKFSKCLDVCRKDLAVQESAIVEV